MNKKIILKYQNFGKKNDFSIRLFFMMTPNYYIYTGIGFGRSVE